MLTYDSLRHCFDRGGSFIACLFFSGSCLPVAQFDVHVVLNLKSFSFVDRNITTCYRNSAENSRVGTMVWLRPV